MKKRKQKLISIAMVVGLLTLNAVIGRMVYARSDWTDGLSDVTAVDATTDTAIVDSSTITASQFISTVLAGTAPFQVVSNTVVANLNSSLLSGLAESAFFQLAQNEIVTGIPAFNGGTSGASAPFSVDSTYVVANLNADLLDGNEASAFATSAHTHPIYVLKAGDTMGGDLNMGAHDISNAGSVSATTLSGNGAAVTNVDAATVDGISASTTATVNYLYPLGAGNKFPNAVLNTGSGNGLDADLLDGYHAANTTGAVPISNTTVNTDLNSDMLDGSHEAAFFKLADDETVTGVPNFNGGLTGATPPFNVDSTFVVANLNADLLDGNHAAAFAPAGDYVMTTGDQMTGPLAITTAAGTGLAIALAGSSGATAGVYITSDNADASSSIITADQTSMGQGAAFTIHKTTSTANALQGYTNGIYPGNAIIGHTIGTAYAITGWSSAAGSGTAVRAYCSHASQTATCMLSDVKGSGRIFEGQNDEVTLFAVDNVGAMWASGTVVNASGYMNFGTTKGTSGYGFHDNGGTLQYKNSGGAWADISSGGVTPTLDQVLTAGNVANTAIKLNGTKGLYFDGATSAMYIVGNPAFNSADYYGFTLRAFESSREAFMADTDFAPVGGSVGCNGGAGIISCNTGGTQISYSAYFETRGTNVGVKAVANNVNNTWTALYATSNTTQDKGASLWAECTGYSTTKRCSRIFNDSGYSFTVESSSEVVKASIDKDGNFMSAGSLEWATSATGPESALTSIGCYTVELINNTGSAITQGRAVANSSATDTSIDLTSADASNTVGFVQDASCANGARCSVGVSGKCYVAIGTGDTCARGYYVQADSDEAGYAECSSTKLSKHIFGYNTVNQAATGQVTVINVQFRN